MTLVKLLSLNVRGLRNHIKRRALFLFLKNQKADFYCLQETFSLKEDEIPWASEWGGKILFSHGTEHSKGTCIMQKPNSLFSLKSLSADPNGRFVIGQIKLGEEELFLTSVYAPCDSQNQSLFIQNLATNVVSKTNTSKAIITGDWNTTLQSIDKKGGRQWHETSYRNSVLSFMDELGLFDTFRTLHPRKKAFTYNSKALKLKSRIDFFLTSHRLEVNIKKAEIRSSIAPDHNATFLSLEINDAFKRGPGTWKFNNQLLEDENYVEQIKCSLPEILQKYQNVESYQLQWELIKMEFRSETITFSKAKRLETKSRESLLQEKLDALDKEICRGNGQLSQPLLDEYESTKQELKGIYEKWGREAIFRSKVSWIEKGEKPTNYFFNLEKRNYEKKVIAQLKLENGEIITDMKQINKEIESYYNDLFRTKFVNNNQQIDFNEDFNEFVDNLEIPKLSFEESNLFEGELTLEEIQTVIKSFQNNKSPGEDGFTKEFYETFFDEIGVHLLNSYNEAFTKGQLSVSQRRGVICLIPKEDSNLNELSNWRPLTLLNVDYKILAKVIAKRIEPALQTLIHTDQTGFMKERFIGQNVRLLNDLMGYAEIKNIPGILLFIDFQKAFDTIEWKFIEKSIELFNFGPNISKWFSIFYNNVESGVMNAGFMTNYFKVSRGVRQGCPLSPLLFVLGVEILALKIRQNQLCRGIELPNGQEAKISQFADDTTLIVDNTGSLREAMNIINTFGSISGLRLNKKKTKAMWIGASRKNKSEPLEFNCPKDPIKFLGTYLSHDEVKNNNNNFFIKIKKMETKLNIWLSRDLTLFGRTMLAKSIGLSQLIYTASMLSVPESVIQQTQSKLFSFLWKNKRDKIKRQVLYRPLDKGGLNFPCFRLAVKALRLSWIARFLNKTNETWKAIPNYYFEKYGGLMFLLNCNYNVKNLDNKIPLFYRELLQFFLDLRSNFVDPLKREFILWNNKDIHIENQSFYWKTWFSKNIVFVQDLLNSQGKFLSIEEFREKYNLNLNFLQYCQITSAIPTWLKRSASEHRNIRQIISLEESHQYQLSKDITLDLRKMRCKQFYKLFVESIDVEPTAIKTWRKYSGEIADQWTTSIQKTFKTTRDNKLKQFYFKLLHRILVTNKELNRFGITNEVQCALCGENDSIEHAFLECQPLITLYQKSLKWFNDLHKTNVKIGPIQMFLNLLPPIPNLSNQQINCLRLLLLLAKQYSYVCKTLQKNADTAEFISKLTFQLKVERKVSLV